MSGRRDGLPAGWSVRRETSGARPVVGNPDGPGALLVMWAVRDASGGLVARHVGRASAVRLALARAEVQALAARWGKGRA